MKEKSKRRRGAGVGGQLEDNREPVRCNAERIMSGDQVVQAG